MVKNCCYPQCEIFLDLISIFAHWPNCCYCRYNVYFAIKAVQDEGLWEVIVCSNIVDIIMSWNLSS